jgi:hypothetical protein
MILPSLRVLLALTWAMPAIAGGPMRCTTYEQKTMNQLYTVCDDGTRATHIWNKTLSRWESTVTPPPGKTCAGQLNPTTHQWEGRCR